MKPFVYGKAMLIVLALSLSGHAYDFSQVDKLIDDSLRVFRDSVLVLVEKDGQLILKTGRGNIDTLTRMRIASASKWISGAVILGCVEKGYVTLDDSLGKYMPKFTANGKGSITIRQCFTMSSGLYGGTKYEQEPFYTLARCADSIADYTPVAYTPGSMWAYDGNGMQAVGHAVEVASGKTWRQLAQEMILGPCGMDSTGYDYYLTNPWIPGGVQTTPADYMKFLRMVIHGGMFAGKRILSQSSIETMFSAPNQGKPLYQEADPLWPIAHPAYLYGMDTVKYGFSSWVLTYNPASSSVEEIASPGAWGTAPWADRCRGLTGVIFMDGGLLGPRAYYTEVSLIGLIRDAVGGGCPVATVKPLQHPVKSSVTLGEPVSRNARAYALNGRCLGPWSGPRTFGGNHVLILYDRGKMSAIFEKR